MTTTTPNFFNKSRIKLFEGSKLSQLEQEVNDFMSRTTKIYNVKPVAIQEDGYQTQYLIMVSYE